MRFRTLSRKLFLAKRTLQNYFALNQFSMIFAKVISLLLNILIIFLIIGNTLIYLKSIHGSVLVILLNIRKFFRKRGPPNFSLALNNDLDEVRGRIMGIALPGFRETFLEVRRQESRKSLMMGKS